MELKHFLVQEIANETDIPVEEISCDEDIMNFNLDSLSILSLAFEVETKFNIEGLDPTIFIEYNTINKLDEWIKKQN